ncbi:MAG: glycosyltransferase [Patescibacteria group bacterium]
MTKQLRIALVYDRVNKWGGAERVLLALHEIWPDAPLFTAVYDADRAKWANVFTVKPSFIQNIPFAKSNHEWFAWLTPMAFESFSFDDYDVVISVTSAEAKYIITKPETLHICYCLTPTRYLWSGNEGYAKSSRILKKLTPRLRRWDIVGSSRPDYYIAISEHVKARIEKYYGRNVEAVIYPPVETDKFKVKELSKDYFLVVSRLVKYKRIDLIIDAFNQLGLPLVIVGTGHEEKLLRHLASDTIHFVSSHLTDEELAAYYGSCRAFLSAADEDFGISMGEAQAAGKPVIAYAQSGASEIVRDGETGILFSEQSQTSIVESVRKLESVSIDPRVCRARAKRFDTSVFMKEMRETVGKLYTEYKKL